MRRTSIAALSTVVCLLAACNSIGPPRIVQDCFDYADAISRSWKDQMLLNLVTIATSPPSAR